MDQETSRCGADLLAIDVDTALGVEVHIDETIPEHLRRLSYPPAWWVHFSVPALKIELGCAPGALTPSGVACELALLIHDDVLSRSGRIWPADPEGGDQPLLPTEHGWRGTTHSIPYGQITAATNPDPALDGVIRWWLPHSFDGLIASRSGDLWFSSWDIHGDTRKIGPGTPVTWHVTEGRHGQYRKATHVQATQL